ncbi:DoxX family protein [Antrihabitans cavernicola]|uniref:DoxX family protein n=1 Tax=Antrihabitans cavernicola TaxID=2495913 RepID=A0A5A7S6D3_9NOCA|nr:DoxX family protein [Spelaeibacter cavernicola]KAA0017966.1 DoxX family protein [Spelaeibacter cavernicola]
MSVLRLPFSNAETVSGLRASGVARGTPLWFVLGFFRIITGLLFVFHGLSELFGIPVAPYGGQTAAFLSWPHWWAGVIELIAGILVTVGFGTRVAALLCSGAMAYAYLVVHQKTGLWPIENGGDLPILFCWSFFLIAFAGPGAFAIRRAL